MFVLAPLFFWAWLNNEEPLQQKETVESEKSKKEQTIKKNRKSGQVKNFGKVKMSFDKAMEIMLDHGFLPQLPAVKLPALIISVQKSRNSNSQNINFLEEKKPIILHFWATWCGPCKRELPHFAIFVSAQDSMNVFTITSELKDDRNEVWTKIWNFYQANNIEGLNVCADINGNLASLLGVSGIPATFLISSDGFLLGRFLGATDWSSPELSKALVAYVK